MELIKKVKDGKIEFPVPFEEGEEILIQAEKVPRLRSLRALRHYFGAIVTAICKKTGHSKEDVHEYLKMELNPKEFPDLKTGEIKTIGGSTRQMTSSEFAIFTAKAEEIAEWVGAEIGTQEQYWDSLSKEPQ